MKRKIRYLFLLLCFACTILSSGCTLQGPDLVVIDGELEISADGLTTTIGFKIQNIGSVASTASRVYVNGVNPNIAEPSDVNQIRKQESFPIVALGSVEETTEYFSIIEQGQPNELGIEYYDIIADPKNEVEETNETNNELRIMVP